MNKVKMLICTVVAAMALTACTIGDNPVDFEAYPIPYAEEGDSTGVNIDNPHEVVTDQPAYAPGR